MPVATTRQVVYLLKIIPAIFAEGRARCNTKQPSVAAPILKHRKPEPASAGPCPAGRLDFVDHVQTPPEEPEQEPILDAVDELAPPPDPGQPPDGTVFGAGDFFKNDDGGDVLSGMAPKQRNPLDHAKVQTFIRRNGAAALPYGHTPAEEQAMVQAFIARNGATQIPLWAATTKFGKRAKEGYNASRRYKPPSGSAAHQQQEAGRRQFYDESMSVAKSGMSLGGCGCPKKGHLACCSGSSGKKRKRDEEWTAADELPSGYCNNRECRLPIGNDRHKDAKYCHGSECRERERYLRNLDRNVANSRKIPGKILGGISIQYRETRYDINRLKSGEKPDFRMPDICEEVDNLLDPFQRAAVIGYKYDIDAVDGRLQLPQDDVRQIRLKREKRQIPRDRIDAVRQALGEDATKLIQKALGQPLRVAYLLPPRRRGVAEMPSDLSIYDDDTIDIEKFRAALDRLAATYAAFNQTQMET